jgi:hypothetical protein
VAQLKSLGFINTFQPFGDKRFIHLIKKPELENISLEVCDLEGVEDLITHDNQNEYTPNQNDTYPSSQGLEPIITTITNNKEYKKDNNDTTLYDLRFNKIVELFPKSKHKGVDEAYNYTWVFLSDRECWLSSTTLQEFYYDSDAQIKKFQLHLYSSLSQSSPDDYIVAVARRSSYSITKMGL